MTRAFIYLRVSTKEQLDKGGYARQLEACRQFAAEKGWVVTREFGDQQSGADKYEARHQLREALSLCTNATGVHTIIVERADRIARDMIEQEVFLRECENNKVLVYCAESGEELVMASSSPDRKLIRRIMGALAEWDRDQISAKLQAGRRRKAIATGRPCGGPRAFGDAKNPERAAAEQAVISFVMCWHGQGYSISKIILALKEQGFKPPNGGPVWHRSVVFGIIDRATKAQHAKASDSV